MKHSLSEYEAEALRLPRSTRELLRNFRSHEAKRDVTFPCGEATLHWAQAHIIAKHIMCTKCNLVHLCPQADNDVELKLK